MAARIASGKPIDPTEAGAFAAASQQAPTAASLRPRLRALRAAMTGAERTAADERIVALLRGRIHEHLQSACPADGPVVVSAFWPIGDEPDLRPALAEWARDARLRLALPVVRAPAAPLEFRQWTPAAVMAEGAYRIPEPRGTAVLVPQILLVPALGFTADGDRIGYGGGFYDRTLAALRHAGGPLLALGVAYECARLAPDVHAPEPHDVRLDAIVSEAGWTPGPGAAAAGRGE